MTRQKKFKIYTHPYLHLDVQKRPQAREKGQKRLRLLALVTDGCYFTGLGILKVLKALGSATFLACYHSGLFLVNSCQRVIKYSVKESRQTASLLSKRYQKLMEPQFKHALALFLLVAFIGSLGFGAMRLVARGLEFKDQIFGIATNGGKSLLQAQDALKKQDMEGAENKFLLAYRSFSNSGQELKETDKLLNQLLGVLPQKRDADKLFAAATLLSKSGADSVEIYKAISDLRLGADGLGSEKPMAETFSVLDGKVDSISKNLTAADEKISGINVNVIPASYRDTFLQMREKLTTLKVAFGNFKDVYGLTKGLVLGNKDILVLFENNNELRATGGFMGTFGNFKMQDGKISKIHISSIYDLDGQLLEKIVPPSPVLNVNNRWYMRDSNWFADFPSSAKKIISFYEKEGGETPDLVIAMTPNLIVDLLKITGPIEMKDYNVTLDADNFIERTQAASTLSQGPLNTPKQVLADFYPLLLQKLSDLPASQWAVVLESLQNNLNSKQIAFYSRSSDLQDQFESYGWSGSVLSADRDYLAVVGSNLGGTKTDLYIDQEISLKTSVSDKGEIIDELTITRTNRLPKLDESGNDSYFRIFVPAGSILVSNTGFDYKNLDASLAAKGAQNDSQVYDWERSSVRDVVSGTTIGQESGKTFFGNWLSVAGGETKTVKITYRLPFTLKDIDRYSLLVQKQMGSKAAKFSWSLDFSGRALEWKSFDTKDLQTSDLTAEKILDRDFFLGAVFRKR